MNKDDFTYLDYHKLVTALNNPKFLLEHITLNEIQKFKEKTVIEKLRIVNNNPNMQRAARLDYEIERRKYENL